MYKDVAKIGRGDESGWDNRLSHQNFLAGYWAPGSTFKHILVIIRQKNVF